MNRPHNFSLSRHSSVKMCGERLTSRRKNRSGDCSGDRAHRSFGAVPAPRLTQTHTSHSQVCRRAVPAAAGSPSTVACPRGRRAGCAASGAARTGTRARTPSSSRRSARASRRARAAAATACRRHRCVRAGRRAHGARVPRARRCPRARRSLSGDGTCAQPARSNSVTTVAACALARASKS